METEKTVFQSGRIVLALPYELLLYNAFDPSYIGAQHEMIMGEFFFVV